MVAGLPSRAPSTSAAPGHGLESLAAAAAAEGRRVPALAIAAGGKASSPAGSGMNSPAVSEGGKRDVLAAAQRICAQAVSVSRPDLWGLLTAVSDKARKRPQGFHIMLHAAEHVLGRVVKEVSCSFDSPNVSGKHCRISRKILAGDGSMKPLQPDFSPGPGERIVVVIRDTSSNGTYVNHLRLRKDGSEECLKHGDLISLVGLPEHENAFAFVFRDVAVSVKTGDGQEVQDLPKQGVKRKVLPGTNAETEEGSSWDGKRLKGVLIGGPDGPVSLDDVRRLQRSNEELREQLEQHVLSIERMRSDYRAAEARHEAELNEVRKNISARFTGEIELAQREIQEKKRELDEMVATFMKQQSMIEDMNQRLIAASLSRVDAEEIIQNQKKNIADLEMQVEEERSHRKKENLDAQATLKAALEKARLEAAEELKQQEDVAAKQYKQQQDKILELQEVDKGNRRLLETLRSKLEREREALVNSEEKVRRLEVQLQEEKNISAAARKIAGEREQELGNLYKDLDIEKKGKEAATGKVSSLELEMETAIRELALEKRRLQGARERIVLRETQLRAFHSTAAEIASLQQKQQDQLKGMLRTLEDGESEDKGGTRTQEEDHRGLDLSHEKSGSHVDRASKSEAEQKELFNPRDSVETVGEPEYGAIQSGGGINREKNGSPCGKDSSDNSHGGQGLPERDQDWDTQQTWLGGETELDCAVVPDSESSDTSMAGDLDVVPDTLIDEDSKEVSISPIFPLEEAKTQLVGVQELNATRGVAAECQAADEGQNVTSIRSSPTRFSFRRMTFAEPSAERQGIANATRLTVLHCEGQVKVRNTDVEGTVAVPEAIAGETMLVDGDETLKRISCWERTQVLVQSEDKIREISGGASFPLVNTEITQVPTAALACAHRGSLFECDVGRGSLTEDLKKSNVLNSSTSDMVAGGQDTGDLVASEVAGSWAVSSERSCQEVKDSKCCDLLEVGYPEAERPEERPGPSQVGTSDSDPTKAGAGPSEVAPILEDLQDVRNSQTRRSYFQPGTEHLVLNEMLSIVAPELSKIHGLQSLVGDAPDSEGSTDDNSDNDSEGRGFEEEGRIRAGVNSQA